MMKKMNRSMGFTLVEMLIVLAVLSVVTMAAVIGCSSCMANEHQKETATTEAQHWAAELGYTLRGVTCADLDSDGDGYVSCTVVVAQGDGVQMLPIECRGAYSWGPRLPDAEAQPRQGDGREPVSHWTGGTMTREEAYDTLINPLMAQIIAVCKEHDIPIVALFQLDDDRHVANAGEVPNLFCTTAIVPEDAHDRLQQMLRIVRPRERTVSHLTITHSDGSKEMIAVME